jgi:hypothetical protein
LSVPAFAESEKKTIKHELQYGVINLASLSFIDGDWSEFPIVGARYKYYFSPVADNKHPYDLQSHLGRNSWLKVDLNALNSNPNLAGKLYFSQRWSLEADFSYQHKTHKDSYTDRNGALKTSKYEEDELLTDLVLNYAVSQQLTLGIGIHNYSENSEYTDIIDDYVESNNSQYDSDTLIAIKARYTSINGGKGLDIASSISHNEERITAKVFTTFYIAKHNAYKAGVVYSDFSDDWNNETLLTISLAHHYWFSHTTAIKYGISWIRVDGNNFGLLDINGTWRF